MFTHAVRFANLILAGLISGILLAIWLGTKPKLLSFPDYIILHKGLVDSYNVLMPLLGLITIVLTLLAAFLQKYDNRTVILLVSGAIMLIIAGLITRLGNQPINDMVMKWDSANPDANWIVIRDKWWSLHLLRFTATFISFCFIGFANILK